MIRTHHLISIIRNNRYIGITALFYTMMLLPGIAERNQWIIFGVSVAFVLGFLLTNETFMATVKKLNKVDPLFTEKVSILLPVLTGLFLMASYALTGQLGILLVSLLPCLHAQFLGYTRLSRMMLVGTAVVYGAGLWMNYPHTLGFTQQFDGVIMLLVLAPFAITLLHFGRSTSGLVKSTADQVEKLQSLAATDGLTGLINRRQFNHQLHAEISRACRHNKPLSLALFDLDDFKKINDFYGHQVGDRILKELGLLIKNNIRESDIPARYGGEEFALILPETSQVEAYDTLERLRAMIERTVFCLPDNPITATISMGIAQLDFKHGTSFEIIEQADTALYEAKRQGKNRVVYGAVATPKIDISALKSL